MKGQRVGPQFASSGIRRALSRGVVWISGGKLIASLLVVVANALLARWLGPEEFGRFLLVVSLATVFGTLALAGIDQALVRLAAQARGRGDGALAETVLFSGLWIGGLLALVGGALLGAAFAAGISGIVFPNTQLRDLALPLGALTTAVAAQTLLGETFRARENYAAAAFLGGQGLYGGTVSALLSVLLVFAATLWWTEPGADAGSAVATAARGGAVLCAVALMAFAVFRPGNARRVVPGPVLALGATLWPTATVLLLLSHIDIWIVGALLGEGDLGAYGAASRLVLLIGIPIFIVNGVLPPLIARLHGAGDVRGLEKLMRGTATLMALPMLVVVAGLLLFPREILTLVFGAGYERGAPVLQWLALGWAVNVAAGSPAKLLMMTEGERALLVLTLLAGLAGACGAVVGAYGWGISGVACAMAMTLAAQNLLCVLLARRRLGFWTSMHLAPARIGAAIGPVVNLLRRPSGVAAAQTD